jgi:hypothetical protein
MEDFSRRRALSKVAGSSVENLRCAGGKRVSYVHFMRRRLASFSGELTLVRSPTVIEAINSRRTAQPQIEAMYLLMPTGSNVNRIVADFSGNQPQYAAAHVFFLDGKGLNTILPRPFIRCLIS